jgi:hypothetical protein
MAQSAQVSNGSTKPERFVGMLPAEFTHVLPHPDLKGQVSGLLHVAHHVAPPRFALDQLVRHVRQGVNATPSTTKLVVHHEASCDRRNAPPTSLRRPRLARQPAAVYQLPVVGAGGPTTRMHVNERLVFAAALDARLHVEFSAHVRGSSMCTVRA